MEQYRMNAKFQYKQVAKVSTGNENTQKRLIQ